MHSLRSWGRGNLTHSNEQQRCSFFNAPPLFSPRRIHLPVEPIRHQLSDHWLPHLEWSFPSPTQQLSSTSHTLLQPSPQNPALTRSLLSFPTSLLNNPSVSLRSIIHCSRPSLMVKRPTLSQQANIHSSRQSSLKQNSFSSNNPVSWN